MEALHLSTQHWEDVQQLPAPFAELGGSGGGGDSG